MAIWDKDLLSTNKSGNVWDRDLITAPVPSVKSESKLEKFRAPTEDEITERGTPAQKESQRRYLSNMALIVGSGSERNSAIENVIRAASESRPGLKEVLPEGDIDWRNREKWAKQLQRRRQAEIITEQQTIVQAEHDRKVWDKEAEKLRGKFLKKGKRRLGRGGIMLVGGALSFMHNVGRLLATKPEFSYIIDKSESNERVKMEADLFNSALKAPEYQAVIENGFDKWAGGTTEILVPMAPAITAGVLSGGTALPATVVGGLTTFALTSNNVQRASLERGESQRTADLRAFGAGLVSTVIEVASGGSGRYFKNKEQLLKVAGSKFAKLKHVTKRLFINAAHESFIQETPQNLSEWAIGNTIPRYENGKINWDAAIEESFDTIVMSFLASTAITGPMEVANIQRVPKIKTRPRLSLKTFANPEKTPLRSERFAVVSAELHGKRGKNIIPEQNHDRTQQLKKDLKDMGVEFEQVEGMYEEPKTSFYVRGMSIENARALGKKYGQESVLIPEGLIYEDGTLRLADLNNINFDGNQTDNFSVINIDGQDVKFSIPLDWNDANLTSLDAKEKQVLFQYGHEVPNQMGMQNAERRAYMSALTGKDSMSDMSPDERGDYMWQLTRDAADHDINLKEIRRKFQPDKELVAQGEKTNKKRGKKYRTHGQLRRRSHVAEVYDNIRESITTYLINMDRARNIARELDGYEADGAFSNLVFTPVKYQETLAKDAASKGMYNMIDKLKERGVNVDGMFNIKSKPEIVPGYPLSDAEMIGIALQAQNKKARTNIEAMFQEDGIDPTQAISDIQDYVDGDEELSYVAQLAKEWRDELSPRFWDTVEMLDLKNVIREENYLPILYDTKKGGPDLADPVQNFLQQFGLGLPGTKHTQARTTRAVNDMNLNIFSIMAHSSRSLERFINLAPTIKAVNNLLSDPEVAKQINIATRNKGVEVLKKWLGDTAAGHADHNMDDISRIEKKWRRAGVVHTLGFKLLSVVPKQAISLAGAVADRPAMLPVVLRNLINVQNYDKLVTRAREKSAIVRNRDWERDLKAVWNDKDVRRAFAGKKISSLSMRPITTVDKYTVAVAWNSAYDVAKNDGLSEPDAVKYADGVVQKSQPMADMSDLPGYFRGGAVAKLATTFMNMPNTNWNYLKHDIYGEAKAGNIAKSRVMYRFLMSQIMPAMLLGLITRGRMRLPTAEETLKDLISFALTPFIFWGKLFYNAATGDWDPVDSALTTMALRGVEEGARAVAAAKRGDTKEAIEKGISSVGAFTGKIPAQVVGTASGAIDLLTGETDDIRRLYYSEGQLERYGD